MNIFLRTYLPHNMKIHESYNPFLFLGTAFRSVKSKSKIPYEKIANGVFRGKRKMQQILKGKDIT